MRDDKTRRNPFRFVFFEFDPAKIGENGQSTPPVAENQASQMQGQSVETFEKLATPQAAVVENTCDSKIEDLVECRICCDTMCNPYVLECGHSFCGDCLSSWLKVLPGELHILRRHALELKPQACVFPQRIPAFICRVQSTIILRDRTTSCFEH